MKIFLVFALAIILCINLAHGEPNARLSCPDHKYMCFDGDGVYLGTICGGTCWHGFDRGCEPCDDWPLVLCQKMNSKARKASMANTTC